MTSSRHSFSGVAIPTTLSGEINSVVTTIPVNTPRLGQHLDERY